MHKVLIADDEPIERAVISRKIQKYYKGQLEIVQAVNGREAMKFFFEEQCEIAILDIEMPGINGLQAAEEIRKKDKECSIIFLTAFDEFSYAKKAIGVKALDYLLKPGSDEELCAVLDEAIQIAQENHTRELVEEKAEEVRQYHDKKDEDISTIENEEMKDVRMGAAKKMILEYIENHYMEEISLQDAAGAMRYADAYFCKLFKQCFDQNFTSYLSAYRVNKAKELLSDITTNVKEISGLVGYHDSNYFAKVFKRIVGLTPSEYRLKQLDKKS